jgi:hypothetical protein
MDFKSTQFSFENTWKICGFRTKRSKFSAGRAVKAPEKKKSTIHITTFIHFLQIFNISYNLCMVYLCVMKEHDSSLGFDECCSLITPAFHNANIRSANSSVFARLYSFVPSNLTEIIRSCSSSKWCTDITHYRERHSLLLLSLHPLYSSLQRTPNLCTPKYVFSVYSLIKHVQQSDILFFQEIADVASSSYSFAANHVGVKDSELKSGKWDT